MKKSMYNMYHVVSSIILFFCLMVGIFLSDNPLIIGSSFFVIIYIIVENGRGKKLLSMFLLFLPFAILIFIINVIIVGEGKTILFHFYFITVTLEAAIYGLILCFKFFTAFALFIILDILVDSDMAVAYFQGILPKSTLMLMIGFKLIPSIKKRFETLKNVYAIRGVSYDGKGIFNKARSYIPVISVLLEDSLEGSFEIGEASYVRGFLSKKKTLYDMPKFKIKDMFLILSSFIFLGATILTSILGLNSFDVYYNFSLKAMLNYGTALIFTSAMLILCNFIINEG